jgi:hypothetical protein
LTNDKISLRVQTTTDWLPGGAKSDRHRRTDNRQVGAMARYTAEIRSANGVRLVAAFHLSLPVVMTNIGIAI